jgi:hypothetical protein
LFALQHESILKAGMRKKQCQDTGKLDYTAQQPILLAAGSCVASRRLSQTTLNSLSSFCETFSLDLNLKPRRRTIQSVSWKAASSEFYSAGLCSSSFLSVGKRDTIVTHCRLNGSYPM